MFGLKRSSAVGTVNLPVRAIQLIRAFKIDKDGKISISQWNAKQFLEVFPASAIFSGISDTERAYKHALEFTKRKSELVIPEELRTLFNDLHEIIPYLSGDESDEYPQEHVNNLILGVLTYLPVWMYFAAREDSHKCLQTAFTCYGSHRFRMYYEDLLAFAYSFGCLRECFCGESNLMLSVICRGNLPKS